MGYRKAGNLEWIEVEYFDGVFQAVRKCLYLSTFQAFYIVDIYPETGEEIYCGSFCRDLAIEKMNKTCNLTCDDENWIKTVGVM